MIKAGIVFPFIESLPADAIIKGTKFPLEFKSN